MSGLHKFFIIAVCLGSVAGIAEIPPVPTLPIPDPKGCYISCKNGTLLGTPTPSGGCTTCAKLANGEAPNICCSNMVLTKGHVDCPL